MIFQMIQGSPWRMVFAIGGMVLMLALVLFASESGKTWKTLWLSGSAFVVFILTLLGAGISSNGGQNEANFRQQLMDEYGVTSSRPFYSIKLDFGQFDEARTVFIKDGKETPIYIKLVDRHKGHYEMAFTVIDDKALYPKKEK